MEVGPQSPAAPYKATADGDTRISMDRSSEPIHDQAPVPTPPGTSAPPVIQGSPRTLFNTSEWRERIDNVLQSDVSFDATARTFAVAHDF